MTLARPAAPLAPRRPRSGRARGFTLLELVISFAILSIVVVSCAKIQSASTLKGARARDLREMRIMADTIFRRIVYEHWKWQDGMRGTADEWYADFAGVPESIKHRWRIYRLELHKKKGMVAGTDPTGRVDKLFEDESGTTTTTNPGTSSGTSSATPSGSTPGSGDEGGAAAGEPAYRIELQVFYESSEEPEMTLRSVIPVPDAERDEDAK